MPLEVSTSTFKWVESSDPFSYVGPHWTDLIWSYYRSKPVSLTAVGQKRRLVRDGINATAIHSDRTQAEREQALSDFKEGRSTVLVATALWMLTV